MTYLRVSMNPAGQPCARLFARELLRRAHPSTSLANTTVLIPNNRSARTNLRVFARRAHSRAFLFPRTTPLGEVGEEEFKPGWDGTDGGADEAIGESLPASRTIHRQLLLTKLVASMRRDRAGGAIRTAVVITGHVVNHSPYMLFVGDADAFRR